MRVVVGSAVGRRAAGESEDAAKQGDRLRRGGDDRARLRAEAEAEHEVVPGVVGAAPAGELVAPGDMMLRAAQRVGALGRKDVTLGAGRKEQELAARQPARALVRAGDGEEAAFALHHDAHCLFDRRADEGDADGAFAGAGPDPFRAGAGLAEAAAGDDRPGPPIPLGLGLALVHLPPPFLRQRANHRGRKGAQHRTAQARREIPQILQDGEHLSPREVRRASMRRLRLERPFAAVAEQEPPAAHRRLRKPNGPRERHAPPLPSSAAPSSEGALRRSPRKRSLLSSAAIASSNVQA